MRRVAAAALGALIVAAGCTGTRSGWREAAWEYPTGPTHVRLERIFEGGAARARATDWLTGRRGGPVLVRPYGVAWDGDDLLVTDPGAGRVLRLAASGRIRASRPGLLGSPIGVAACDGGIVVTDSRSGRVALLDRSLRLVRWLAEGLRRPTGVTCVDEWIVIAETGAHRLVLLGPGGERRELGTRGEGPGEFNFPVALAADGSTVWVGDTLNFRVQRIEVPSGRPLVAFGELGDAPGELPRIKGITVDRNGYLWVTEERLDQVALYRRDGRLLTALGGPGREPGRFTFPAGIAVGPDGAVAVVDSFNRRIQVFRLVSGREAGDE